MCLLVETIYIENGTVRNSIYHTERFNRSRLELFGISPIDDISSVIQIPAENRSGTLRCRLIYGEEIGQPSFDSVPPKRVQSLRLVDGGSIDYSHKYLDRRGLDHLFSQREECDDILIIKGGLVTDTFSGNILFIKGDLRVTPASPLLRGTMRQSLIESGYVSEKNISPEDLAMYEEFFIISALRLPGEVRGLVKNIF